MSIFYAYDYSCGCSNCKTAEKVLGTKQIKKSLKRKIPRYSWESSDEQLRNRMMSIKLVDQDSIDPKKPYKVEEGDGFVTVWQEAG